MNTKQTILSKRKKNSADITEINPQSQKFGCFNHRTIQKLAKKNGIRANQKKCVLINLLKQKGFVFQKGFPHPQLSGKLKYKPTRRELQPSQTSLTHKTSPEREYTTEDEASSSQISMQEQSQIKLQAKINRLEEKVDNMEHICMKVQEIVAGLQASLRNKRLNPSPKEKFKIQQEQKLKLQAQLSLNKQYKAGFLNNDNRWCNNCLLVNCGHNSRDCDLPYTGLRENGQKLWRKTARIVDGFKLGTSLSKETVIDVLLTEYDSLVVQESQDGTNIPVTRSFLKEYQFNQNDVFVINPELIRRILADQDKEQFRTWFKDELTGKSNELNAVSDVSENAHHA